MSWSLVGAAAAVHLSSAVGPTPLWACASRTWDREVHAVRAAAFEGRHGAIVGRVEVSLRSDEAHAALLSATVVYGPGPGGISAPGDPTEIRIDVADRAARVDWSGRISLGGETFAEGDFDWSTPKDSASIGTLVARIPMDRRPAVGAALERGDVVHLGIRSVRTADFEDIALQPAPQRAWLPMAIEGLRLANQALQGDRSAREEGDYSISCWQSYPPPAR